MFVQVSIVSRDTHTQAILQETFAELLYDDDRIDLRRAHVLEIRLRGTGMVLEVEAIVTYTGSLTPGNRRLHVIETLQVQPPLPTKA